MIAIRLVKDGAVLREAAFSQLPIDIGRGDENGFVVFDSSVSRVHARLEQTPEGGVLLRDLGSRNGTHVGPTRVENVQITGRLKCHIGRVEIEIECLTAEDTQEVEALEWRHLEQRRTLADHVRYIVGGVLGWLALTALEPQFWSPWREDRGVSLLNNGLGALITVPTAGFVLLVVLKAVGRRVRVADTLRAVARLVWVWPVLLGASFVGYYVFTASAHAAFRALLTGAGLVICVVYAAGLRRTRSTRRFRVAWAVIVSAIYLGLHATGSLAARKLGMPQVDYHVQAPLGGYPGPSLGLDAYLGQVGQSAAQAARAAEAVRVRQADD